VTRALLYATRNPGKLMELRALAETMDLTIAAPEDFGLDVDVPEDGATLEENAIQKALAYQQALHGADVVVLGDDTGVEIDALDGEPGIHVRRWNGTRMTDEAIIEYCMLRMQGVPAGQRGAQFRTVFAIAAPGGVLELVDGTLRGDILEQPDPLRIEGFPFESVFFVPEWGRLLGELYSLPPAEKACCVTHRERALRQALPRLRALLNGDGA
jgi:XTP/dITP diphosphohydrolase